MLQYLSRVGRVVAVVLICGVAAVFAVARGGLRVERPAGTGHPHHAVSAKVHSVKGHRPPGASAETAPSDVSTYLTTDVPVGEDDGYQAFLTQAEGWIGSYWSYALPKDFGVGYTDLASGVNGYDPLYDPPVCNGVQMASASSQSNAFYCGTEDAIVYDDSFLHQQYAEDGNASVAFILAHEWGHAIAKRLSLSPLTGYYAEVQADCFAGAWMGDAQRLNQITVDQTDLQNITVVMNSLADNRADRTGEPDGHGDGAERTDAFNNGYWSGPAACIS